MVRVLARYARGSGFKSWLRLDVSPPVTKINISYYFKFNPANEVTAHGTISILRWYDPCCDVLFIKIKSSVIFFR